MQNSEIITGLRNLAQTGSQYRRTVWRLAADALEYQAQRIVALEKEVRYSSLRYTCANNGAKCHNGNPVPEPDAACGAFEWRGNKA